MRFRTVFWTVLLAASTFGVYRFVMPQQRTFGTSETWVKLEDPRISESSGLAPSYRYPGQFYTHNDSGDQARVFRFDERGKVRQIKVSGAQSVDWEDMASAKLGGKPYLYLGDIGDNPGNRPEIVVYRVPEPGDVDTVSVDQVIRLRYPDEPHNAETLLVHPKTGDLFVVTKASQRPSMVFRLAKPLRSGTYTLTKLGEISLGSMIRQTKLVTGGAISPDGKFVMLRTYLGGFEYPVSGRFTDWWKATPTPVKIALEAQGEAITYSLDGKFVLTSSELTPCLVSRLIVGPKE